MRATASAPAVIESLFPFVESTQQAVDESIERLDRSSARRRVSSGRVAGAVHTSTDCPEQGTPRSFGEGHTSRSECGHY
ncbi:hypothetical protein AArcMg_2980 [Natrarchaeobaculum sulfurireducens]|uniref:Uncharacterized protein n=1 Tax=Natrarchaeobaculum sulfurireducens TaxID=2044521 RepID=A0A346PTX3_9EURY|nr:hypothetical protein AArcMg_2980 [Natrarchaeobaculum sulfurireducens]